jgi:hypothetical protein
VKIGLPQLLDLRAFDHPSIPNKGHTLCPKTLGYLLNLRIAVGLAQQDAVICFAIYFSFTLVEVHI